LAADDPFDSPASLKNTIMYYLDICTTSIFLLECILKVVKDGLIANGPNSYLRKGWNVLGKKIIAFRNLQNA
jgi:hypothetical protein